YLTTITIDYAVEYSIAGSRWRNIDGTVTAQPEPLIFTAWNVKTVLVSEDCITNPKSTGCHD
ncbi:MAG: PKD domain-containing protein, partial [Rhodoglobus sp.]